MTPVEWLERDYDRIMVLETEKHYGWGEDVTIPEWNFIYPSHYINEYDGNANVGPMIGLKDDLYFWRGEE
jgi:hypothetical protein